MTLTKRHDLGQKKKKKELRDGIINKAHKAIAYYLLLLNLFKLIKFLDGIQHLPIGLLS